MQLLIATPVFSFVESRVCLHTSLLRQDVEKVRRFVQQTRETAESRINGKTLGEDQCLATHANEIPMVPGMNILQNSSRKICSAFIFAGHGSYAGIDAQVTDPILP